MRECHFSGVQILGNGWRLIISGPIGGGGWATWVEELILLISSCAGNTIFLQLRRNPCSEMIFHHLCVFYQYLTKFIPLTLCFFYDVVKFVLFWSFILCLAYGWCSSHMCFVQHFVAGLQATETRQDNTVQLFHVALEKALYLAAGAGELEM